MIDKIHRFQGHGSLRFVYQKGQTVRGQHCSLKYIINKRRRTFRVAVVVSRKVHKSAVVRNRIRRRMYEALRRNSFKIVQPFDLVFTAYSDQLADMPSDQLERAVLEKLEKAGVFDMPGRA
ncbi:MAG TPA: ribonuclease P protein component [Candidatus Saccharimonadales bacterium]|nr:ribonuclease P protein component [Candidatus Saccharimonadales bacterium]